MNSEILIPVGIVALVAAAIVIYLIRQSQKLKLSEVSHQEKLLAREAEVESLQQRAQQLEADNSALKHDYQLVREEKASLTTSLDLEKKQFQEKLKIIDESKQVLGDAFKNLANEIFDEKSKKFEAKNKESLSLVLSPLQEKISQFEKRVEETYDKESKERFSLGKEIETLRELNAQISMDAVNLTNALKGDNKAQGNWGELVLESVLEKSGLSKGREYEVQVSLEADDGSRSQPDVIVHLPESRDIIIDSKVSLKAWDSYCSSEDEEERAELLKQHLQSIRLHVKGLSAKDYQKLSGINSLDYVFLFMPIEAAYLQANQLDPELSQYAFEKNIIFVGPTMLLTTLKLAQNLWRLDQQNKNANEIARQAGNLYDKFVNFVDDLDDIGKKIDSSKKSFTDAQNKLVSGTGNLVKRVETLKQLGAKTSKQLKADTLSQSGVDDEAEGAMAVDIDKANKENKEQKDKTRH
ncbi:MAG: DNA recombination protein RmuC [Gammaproteobacteria bacterium]|jgi:DNA recombination protein RmuC|nr:DNA recombination protein RmuC [Gammaproteobacteria bacterium]MBT3860405.1 DNA recombination protein RmuC [Gammaproteobacteria bacterium]MBT3986020.1 DNA recombination protein RmuC [Gammaproteobacteria bacterium]MBT4256425.1 DNA recombination protein RmuC [Gammaproteobacteria bacterium]MBT4582382.1 DNA recombination protein RmuC [Gammaproteobacteria bacterium]